MVRAAINSSTRHITIFHRPGFYVGAPGADKVHMLYRRDHKTQNSSIRTFDFQSLLLFVPKERLSESRQVSNASSRKGYFLRIDESEFEINRPTIPLSPRHSLWLAQGLAPPDCLLLSRLFSSFHSICQEREIPYCAHLLESEEVRLLTVLFAPSVTDDHSFQRYSELKNHFLGPVVFLLFLWK